MPMITCNCGSGLWSAWEYDARGIPLCRACDSCRKKKLSGYRPEVLTNSNYAADESIEPEDDLGPDPLGDWHGRNE